MTVSSERISLWLPHQIWYCSSEMNVSSVLKAQLNQCFHHLHSSPFFVHIHEHLMEELYFGLR